MVDKKDYRSFKVKGDTKKLIQKIKKHLDKNSRVNTTEDTIIWVALQREVQNLKLDWHIPNLYVGMVNPYIILTMKNIKERLNIIAKERDILFKKIDVLVTEMIKKLEDKDEK